MLLSNIVSTIISIIALAVSIGIAIYTVCANKKLQTNKLNYERRADEFSNTDKILHNDLSNLIRRINENKIDKMKVYNNWKTIRDSLNKSISFLYIENNEFYKLLKKEILEIDNEFANFSNSKEVYIIKVNIDNKIKELFDIISDYVKTGKVK